MLLVGVVIACVCAGGGGGYFQIFIVWSGPPPAGKNDVPNFNRVK